MNDTLKVAGRIGAELGAAKADNDRLREVLSRIANLPMYQCSTENDYRLSAAKAMAVGALTHQADPTETTEAYTARDMATAAAQGFRDGQAAVEPAAAQGEQQPTVVPEGWLIELGFDVLDRPFRFVESKSHTPTIKVILPPCEPDDSSAWDLRDEVAQRIGSALATPIAQTAPQPELVMPVALGSVNADYDKGWADHAAEVVRLNAGLSAQGAGKFRMGDLVKKSTGSEWVGRVVGWYSTNQTPEGYAVESSAHRNSVQIYPARALEAVE